MRVAGGTIFFWESDNPNKTFPVIWLDLWKIFCFRSNLFRRKMFDYNRPAPILLKPGPQRQALICSIYQLQHRKLYSITVLYTYLSNSNVKADVWVNYSESYSTVGERTVALKIIACCSITQTPTGQSKVWWWHARKMVVIYFKRI